MQPTLLRVFLGIAAMLCGVRALGYWVVLQNLSGPHLAETGETIVVLCLSALLFLVLTSLSAYLGQRMNGVRAVLVKSLYLTGAYGLPPIVLFAVASRGAVLRMPEVTALLVLFAGLFVLFSLRFSRHNA